MKLLIKNIIVLFILIIFTEIFLWLAFPITYPIQDNTINTYIPSSHEKNKKLHFYSNEGLYGIDSNITFSTNNFGFRGSNITEKKEPKEYRIFLVGGSTTENLYVTDTRSVEKQLEEKLNVNSSSNIKVSVLNAGKSGDISTDHLSMIAHRINHLEPDLIILLAGINDLFRSIRGYDYLHMPTESKVNYLKICRNILISLSQITRRILIIKNKISATNNIEKITFSTRYQDLFQDNQMLEIVRLDTEFSTKYFQNNLNSIVGLCKANNIDVILMTQPTTWNSTISTNIKKCHWMTKANETKRYSEVDLENLMSKFNNVTKSIADKHKLLLIDLEEIIPASEEYFFDDCHFNNGGADLLSNLLETVITQSNLIHTKESNRK